MAAWFAQWETVENGSGHRARLHAGSVSLSYADVLNHWTDDEGFRIWFSEQLAACPFAAFRWETPPVTRATIHQSFEFVLLDAPELDRAADASDFAEYFQGAGDGTVATFANLGGDAILVVPVPAASNTAYPHLGAFVREAPDTQQSALWQGVAEAMERRLGDRPVWLNTAGAGVPWLHVRLDDRPKYYGHAPYRDDSP